MDNKQVSVLDVVARLENLERENSLLKKDLDEIKSQLAPENWQDLIIYRPLGHQNNKPLEISWSEIDDDAKREWYKTGEPSKRDVIGLVRRKT